MIASSQQKRSPSPFLSLPQPVELITKSTSTLRLSLQRFGPMLMVQRDSSPSRSHAVHMPKFGSACRLLSPSQSVRAYPWLPAPFPSQTNAMLCMKCCWLVLPRLSREIDLHGGMFHNQVFYLWQGRGCLHTLRHQSRH